MIADLALVIALAASAWMGWIQGSIRMIVRLAVFLATTFLALLLAGPIAGLAARSPTLQDVTAGWLAPALDRSQSALQTVREAIDRLLLPPILDRLLESNIGKTGAALPDSVLAQSREAMLAGMARFVLTALVIVLLFVIGSFLLRRLAGTLTRRLDQTPILGTVNRLAGLVLGLVYGLCAVSLALLLIALLAPLMPRVVQGIQDSRLVRPLYGQNGFALILSAIRGSS